MHRRYHGWTLVSPSPPCSRVALALICHQYVYLGRLWYALEVSAFSSSFDGLEVFAEVCPRLSQHNGSAVTSTNNGLKVSASQSPQLSAQDQSKESFCYASPRQPNSNLLVYQFSCGVHVQLLHCFSPSKDLKMALES